jgi:tetratricopeptide (TPR) repeat protein
MNSALRPSIINDVVLLAMISNAFWLTIFLVCIGFFRSEIRALLGSLSSVSVAGSHFELGDKKLTFKSYAILSNIFLDLLSNSANCDLVAGLFSEVNAQQLTKFTMKYLLEAPKEETNFILIRNIAYIAAQRGRLQDSLALYNFLIEKAPNDLDLRNNMGIVLLAANPSEAKRVYGGLMSENPGVLLYRYNYALTNIALDNFDEGIKDLEHVIQGGYWPSDPEIFNKAPIKRLEKYRPEDYARLIALVQGEKQRLQQAQ